MVKDGTDRGGRRVRAGVKPGPLGEKLALRILGCGGGVRSVPGIVDSVVGRRPNTGARLGCLFNQNSHAIRIPKLCAAPQNVAIPTVQFQRLKYMSGNCVRHF